MRIRFVLIKVKQAMEEAVYYKLSNTPGVVDLQSLFGPYDLISKIETEEVKPVMDFVTEKISSVTGIVNNENLTAFSFRFHRQV